MQGLFNGLRNGNQGMFDDIPENLMMQVESNTRPASRRKRNASTFSKTSEELSKIMRYYN
jgi:hypothetical protein